MCPQITPPTDSPTLPVRCLGRVAAFALLAAIGAQAQSSDVTDLNLEDLKNVQVYSASTYLQDSREAPSSVTIVTADQIREFGYRTLAEILQSVCGFDITNDRNYSYVGVRGFGRPGDYDDRVLVMIDGRPINDNVYDSALVGTEFPLDVDLIERVEIVRGPSSSLYGTSAFFAVINIITRKTDSLNGLELSGAAGGFNTYEGRSSYGLSRHGVDMLFSGTLYDSAGPSRLFFPAFDNPEDNYGVAQNLDGDNSRSFFGDVRYRNFTLEAVGSRREKNIPTASFGTGFDDNGTHTVDSEGFVDLQYQRQFAHETDFTTAVSYNRYEYHGVYSYPEQNETDLINNDLARGDWWDVKSSITRPFWRKHKATLGASFQDNPRQDQINYDVNPYALRLNDLRSSTQWAVYGQDEFTITNRLILYAGLRHDQYQTLGGSTNPRFALIYSPLKRTTFKLLYGEAFRAPNYYELYYGDHVSQEANPLLRPERIRATELVWEQEVIRDFRFSSSVYQNRISDLISQQEDPKNGFLVFENAENARGQGVEFALAGKLHDEVEGRITYALQNTYDTATHLMLTNSPQQMAKLNLNYSMFHRNLSAGFEAQYMDIRKTLDGSVTGAYTLANLTLTSREFAGGFRLSGSIYNLFDTRYSDPVGEEIVTTAVRQNGRDFRIKLSRTFHWR